MLPLLAQLVAPPLQNSPIRLPGPEAGETRPQPGQPTPPVPVEIEPGTGTSEPPPGEVPPSQPQSPPQGEPTPLPSIQGETPFSPVELQRILGTCAQQPDRAAALNACAAALSARLVADGYVNSRVYVRDTPAPGGLEVVEGRVVELRVTGKDERLNRRVARLLRPLQGSVLHVPSVERELQLLKRLPGVSAVRGNLSRLGSDPSQAVFTVSVEPGAQRWQGEFSARNDGTNGSGDARLLGTLVKGDLATRGDTLLLYGELDGETDGSLGAVITSLSYTLPLADQWNFTGAFGYSRRNLIELPSPSDGISTVQYQGLGQLERVFHETLSQRWSFFAGFSGNRSNTYLDGRALPDLVPESVRSPSSGYVRLGLSANGFADRVGWGGNVYLLQGISAVTPEAQRKELAVADIVPGKATALGAIASTAWAFAPSWQLNLRAAGQVAFRPLTSPMQFTLGSDVGLRGLPGQLISGDSGWLGTAEVSWSFWQNGSNTFQIVPFFGVGGVQTNLAGVSFSDTVGSGGLLARWLNGNHWLVELGWVEQFQVDDNPGPWTDWVLGKGFYAQLKYRF
ncbi:MAG: ShlB/FhaC/HecB family hemolysin secretion/activation protein [Synechococcus sp.]